jgi:hypothetical protein
MTFARLAFGISILVSSVPCHAGCREQLTTALPDGGTILFGEVHGTTEIPRFFLDCVTESVGNNESIEVLLELDTGENEKLKKFANGQISETDLLQSPHLKKTDGRASIAMLSLVRALKDLQGGQIVARGFDARGADRDRAMMSNLVSLRGAKRYSLVLTGNLHARLIRGVAWNTAFTPFATHLRDHGEHVISLNVHYTEGTAWTCSPDCGITTLSPPAKKGYCLKGSASSCDQTIRLTPDFFRLAR